MRIWKIVALAALATAVVSGTAVALAAGEATTGPWTAAGSFVADEGPDAAAACGGPGGALLTDPEAREDLAALRGEHRADMRAWWEKYGDDSRSEQAQKALEELRAEHRAQLLELFERYGVTPPPGLSGDGAGPCGGFGGGWGAGAGSEPSAGRGCGGAGAAPGQGRAMMGGGLTAGQSMW
jgi:hypothetical protein